MKLNQLVEFNPKETIKPNTLVKKISMDQLGIFTRKIANFSYEFYFNGSKFRNGDTLMARISPCLENGKTAYVNILDENEVAFGSTEFTVIRARSNVCISEFAYYLTISSLVRPYAIESMIGSTGRQRVQQDVVENLEIPYYSLSDQQHIVNILGSIDEKIENNELKISDLEQFLMDKFIKVSSKMTKFECRKAEDVFDISIGRTPPRQEQQWFQGIKVQDNMKWITISDMGNSKVFIFDTNEYLTNDAITNFNIPVIKANTVILSFKLTVGRVNITTENMLSNEAIAHFNTDNNLLLPYTYCYLKNFNYNDLGSTSSIATATNSKAIKNMPFILPKNSYIYKFYKFGNPILTKILSLQRQNNKLTKLKQLYLKKFFN